jgi:hypothetical protein
MLNIFQLGTMLSFPNRANATVVEVVGTNVATGSNTGNVVFSRAPLLGEIILIFTGTNTSVNTTTPTGFTLKQTLGAVQKNYSFYKIATSSESTTYTVNFSSTVDTKTIIGVLVSAYNPTSTFATDRSLNSGSVSTPQPLITTPFSALNGSLVFVHLKLAGNFRGASTLDNGFTLAKELTSSGSMQSLLGWKKITADDLALTTSWGWTGGSTGFLTNWLILNP